MATVPAEAEASEPTFPKALSPGLRSADANVVASARLAASAQGCAGRARRASAALSSAGLLAARGPARIHI